MGALAGAKAAGLRLVPVPTDRDGIPPDALADALARTGAKLTYVQPRYANPTGTVLSRNRRQAVLDAVAAHGSFLIEDDWMRDFDLGPPSPPPLVSLDEPPAPYLRLSYAEADGPMLVTGVGILHAVLAATT